MTTFGLDVPAFTSDEPVRFYQRFVRAAEEAGFDNLWVGDHLLWHRPRFETFTLLGMLAGMTRLTVGTGIALAPLRPPWWLAKSAATLERLAPGGCVIGLGTGGEYPREFELAGVPRDRRGALLDESLSYCRAAWSGEAGADFSPTPGRSIPLWVAGRRGAALRRAAERADGWLGLFLTPDQFAERCRLLADHRLADAAPMTTAMALWVCVAEDEATARDLGLEVISGEYQMSAERFARHVVTGDVETVSAAVAAYLDAGAGHLDIHLAHPDPLSQIEVWGREILPLLGRPARPVGAEG